MADTVITSAARIDENINNSYLRTIFRAIDERLRNTKKY